MKHRMILASLVVGCIAVVASCTKVPLGDPSTSKVDPRLTGAWICTANGANELVAVAPFDDRAYVIEQIGFDLDGPDPRATGRRSLKGWLTDVKGQQFLTLMELAQVADKTPEKDRVYAIYRLNHGDSGLTVTEINYEFAAVKSATTPAEMAKAIESNVEKAELYGEAKLYKPMNLARAEDKRLWDRLYLGKEGER